MLSKDTLKLMTSEIVLGKAKVVIRRGKLMVVGSR